jgi:cytochrome c551/c552
LRSLLLPASVFACLAATIGGVCVNSAPVPKVAQGKILLERQGCNHCHIVEGAGGLVAPPLDGIASHRSKQQLVDRLIGKKPTGAASKVVPETLMTHVKVSRRHARQIADYLLTLKTVTPATRGHGGAADVSDAVPAGAQFVPLAVSAETEQGAELYWERGCIACHSIGPVGGSLGPNLAGIGAKRSKKFIENRIMAGATLLPTPGEAVEKFAMPPQDITSEDADKLAKFLLTLPADASEYRP